jgi:hypothetical protein
MSYKTYIKSIAKKLNKRYDFSITSLQKDKEFFKLVAYIGACQQVVYDYYNPNYVFTIPKNVNITNFNSVYQDVKTFLLHNKSLKNYKDQSLNYDSLFELLLLKDHDLIKNNYLDISKHDISKSKSKLYTDVNEIIHDGWALKTYFEGHTDGYLKFKSKSDPIWKNPNRIKQLHFHIDLPDKVDVYKDIPMAAALQFALNYFKN